MKSQMKKKVDLYHFKYKRSEKEKKVTDELEKRATKLKTLAYFILFLDFTHFL